MLRKMPMAFLAGSRQDKQLPDIGGNDKSRASSGSSGKSENNFLYAV